ncbi:MAG: methyltransferase domain-containing protein [Candidatus Rokubacteria bacterium]|nr:methyltransferase domain-containing protein [Candidatus Rokubacteria bacterium]
MEITKLPYPDRTLDVVLSTWTFKALADPRAAVRELLRVIYGFSTRPESGLAGGS